MESDKKVKERPPHPRAKANVFSILTFSWTLDLFFKGFKKDLEVSDLYTTLEDHGSSTLGNTLERHWNRELANADKSNRNPSLLRALVKMFGWRMMVYGIVLAIIEIVMSIVQAVYIGQTVAYFAPDSKMTWIDIYVSASGLAICSALKSLFFTMYDMGTAHVGMKARVANCSLIYKKPFCIRQIIGCFNTNGIKFNKEDAYYYAFVLSITAVLFSTHKHWCHVNILQVGMTVRTALCSVVYKKALRLSKTALGETTVGQVVNLLSNDVNRFDIAVIFLHYLWIGPLETVIVTYFLWLEIDAASLIGVAVLLLFIPLQGYLGKKTSSLRLKTAIRTDERVRLMNEIISGIQVIKMYTWELPFTKLVEQARKKEIREIQGTSYIRGILLSFIIFHSRIALFFSIFSYVIVGNTITAQKVFVITSYFNILRQTMTVFFPQGIGQIAEALVSIRRLQKFLLYEENEQYTNLISMNGLKRTPIYRKMNSKEPNDANPSDKNNSAVNNDVKLGKYSIVIKNATAKWTPQLADNSLNNINLSVERGGLIAVIGTVGSGKSSLLQAILRELPLNDGYINISGTISYASQEPWLFAGSVRQNILFGLPMNRDRYREVVRVCALKTDFEQFPYGDKTLVGERGVSLSGGQRARVNLARAIYKEADIYLLDDPLSAVDTHVGKHLFEECISGYLKDKTCILITHQLQYLNSVDHIVLLEQGSIIAEGSFQELQETGLDFTNLLANSEEEEETEVVKTDDIDIFNTRLHTRQTSIQSVASSADDVGLRDQNPSAVEETRSTGNVGFYVYKSYFSFGGHFCFVFFMFLTCILAQLFASGSDAWITYWVNLEEHVYPCRDQSNDTDCRSPNLLFYVDRKTSIYIFAVITFLMVVITLIRSMTFVKMCMNASMKLHNFMFEGITKANMYFFNTNPSGRILNRFSKDMGSIDEVLQAALIDCIQIGLALLGIVVVVAAVNIWLLIPTFTIAILFYFLRQFYVSTSRSIKRLEGITRSPVFSHLNASLNGLTTIRAFGAQTILEKEFDNHQDLHSSAWYLFLASSRAFGFWLDMVCVVYIAIVTFSFLLIGGDTFGGNVGLAITQAIGLTGMFQWGMRQSAELENQMTAVERVLEYGKITPESSLLCKPVIQPPAEWPSKGEIIFRKMYLRYEPKGSHILKNLNFSIKPEEKVGIVGRTGAGKSSLIAALFKLAENEGEIIIDGLDINKMGLHEVRSKISIIPQEPVLFSGTMRKNLDPFDEYPDHVLWTALEQVELKEAVQDLTGGLNAKMSEGGTNFSVGQRQLVCLARAIIRNNKILILDEATANVDPQTDALIQITIREKFKKCTVLTIAHRLNTVMDSDKVLVMDGGTCVEFNHPYILLQNENGFLHKMLQQTGRTTSDHLYNVAAENYRKLMSSRIPHIDEDVTDVPDYKKIV